VYPSESSKGLLGGFKNRKQADQPRHFKDLTGQSMQPAQDQGPGSGLQLLGDGKKTAQTHAADILQAFEIRDQVLAAVSDPAVAGLFELVGVFGIHAARYFEQHGLFKFSRLDIHEGISLARVESRTQLTNPASSIYCVTIASFSGPRYPQFWAFE